MYRPKEASVEVKKERRRSRGWNGLDWGYDYSEDSSEVTQEISVYFNYY